MGHTGSGYSPFPATVAKGHAVARDDELETDGIDSVDAGTLAVEREDERPDAPEPWPQLSPLELEVCLADAAAHPALTRGGPRA